MNVVKKMGKLYKNIYNLYISIYYKKSSIFS